MKTLLAVVCFLFAALGCAMSDDLLSSYLGLRQSGDDKWKWDHYTLLTGPTNYVVQPGDRMLGAVCTAGNVTFLLPQANTNYANSNMTWTITCFKATADTNSMVVQPWTNGATSYGLATNSITWRDSTGIVHSQATKLTETNQLVGYRLVFGPDGKSVGAIP